MESKNKFLKYLVNSYYQHTGTPLVMPTDDFLTALDQLPFPVLSHGTEPSPILNYANAKALELWETSYENFVGLASKHTAEEDLHTVREALLEEVKQKGFSTNYTGVRISRKGNRFTIENATVWNVVNEKNEIIGQAATFKTWTPIN